MKTNKQKKKEGHADTNLIEMARWEELWSLNNNFDSSPEHLEYRRIRISVTTFSLINNKTTSRFHESQKT